MSNQPLPPGLDAFLRDFWTRQMNTAENMREDGLKDTVLPLARIKKVMKMDPDVKMISSDAPLLLSKACEIFISEVTSRAWKLAEVSKRRTLQRIDVAGAVGQSDQFDFLIDIVPPEYGHVKHKARRERQPKMEDDDSDGAQSPALSVVIDDGEHAARSNPLAPSADTVAMSTVVES